MLLIIPSQKTIKTPRNLLHIIKLIKKPNYLHVDIFALWRLVISFYTLTFKMISTVFNVIHKHHAVRWKSILLHVARLVQISTLCFKIIIDKFKKWSNWCTISLLIFSFMIGIYLKKGVSITLQLYYYMYLYVIQFEDQFVFVLFWLCHADNILIWPFVYEYATKTNQTLYLR